MIGLDLQKELGDQFPLTAEQMGQAYAKAMDSVVKETPKVVEETAKSASQMSKIWDNFVENTQRALGDTLFNGMTGKFTDIEQVFKDMLFRMAADAAAANIMSALFGTPTTGGNRSGGVNWAGLAASLFSFDGGGSTGSGARSGGVDGKGGFPAILHPNETVIDHTKGQSTGTVINMGNTTINVDSRADRQQVLSDVSRLIDTRQNQLVDRLQRTGQLA